MQEASLSGVLKIILIILLVYYALKLITRFLGPVLLNYITKKAGQQFEQRFSNTQGQEQQTTQTNNNAKSKVKGTTKKDVGEYIDFEEIE